MPTLPADAPLVQRLLTASALPRLGGATWHRPPSDSPTPIGACNDLGMDGIGASRSVRRNFTAGGVHAANVVAKVPDAMTAHRALKVLEAARDHCDARPGPLTAVPVEGGTGWWYRTGAGKHSAGFGVAVVGTRFSLVALDHARRTAVTAAMPGLVGLAASRIR